MTKFSSSTCISLFVFCLLLPLQLVLVVKAQDAPVLQSKWDLPVPDLLFCETSQFLFRFDMSTLIENAMTKVFLFRGENCDIDIWDNNYLIPQIEYDLAPADDGDLVRQIALVLVPDISLIGNSPIYTIDPSGVTGTLHFCIRLEIYTQDGLTKVNWRDVDYSQLTTLQEGVRRLEIKSYDSSSGVQSYRRLQTGLDCTTGYDVVFENWWDTVESGGAGPVEVTPVNTTYEEPNADDDGIGVMVGPADIVNTINLVNFTLAYNLDAFVCDTNNAPTIVPVYEQGDIFRICITPDEEATTDGLFMRQLDSMYYSKDGVELIQYAIEGGVADFFGFSEFECTPGTSVCWVETILRAEWFAVPGLVTMSGIGTLQFGSGSRRSLNNLITDGNQRELQNQNGEERGIFTFEFPVTTFQETLNHNNGSASSSNTVSQPQAILLVLLCFILITNCIFVFWLRQSRRIQNTIQGERLLKQRSKSRSNFDRDLHEGCGTENVQSQRKHNNKGKGWDA